MFCPICHSLSLRGFNIGQNDRTFISGPAPAAENNIRLSYCAACDAAFAQSIYGMDWDVELKRQASGNVDYYAAKFSPEDLDRELEANRDIVHGFINHARGRDTYVEIGVGLGMLTRAASNYFGNCYGLDLEVDTAQSIASVPGNVEFVQHAAFVKRDPMPIDVLCAWHVVEHLDNPHEVLQPLLKHIRPGGLFVGQVPLLRQQHVFEGHFVFYSERSFLNLLQPYGFFPVIMQRDETHQFLSFCFRMSLN